MRNAQQFPDVQLFAGQYTSGCAKEFGESGRDGLQRCVLNVKKMGQFLVLPCPEAHEALSHEVPVPFGTRIEP